jgi:[acyl-carrier-protein] S-malonyltransferase
MEKALNELNFNYPTVPIISNISALPEKEISKLKQNLIDQVTGTVRWRETMNLANKLGVNTIIELGNGKVLSGIAKRMIDNVRAINVEKPSDFDEIIKKI